MRAETGPGAARGYWDAVGGTWASTHRDGLWRRCSDAIHAQWLERAAGSLPPGRVLKTDLFDEAFGDGLAQWFESRGHEVVACDLALATARGAARKSPSRAAAVADVRALPFSPMAFATVFSDSTLDHFDSESGIRQSLAELRRVLRPGGTLLLTMDNPANPLVRLRNLSPGFWMRLGVVPYAVGATCGARRLTRVLEEAGFDVLAVETIMHVPRVLMVPLCRRLARRGTGHPGRRLREWLRRFERLGRLPSSAVTGHFVAVVARRPTGAGVTCRSSG
jgi:SAM-dependent methyltransferase